MSALCLPREGSREELRRKFRVDLQRVEIDERQVGVLGQRGHDGPLVEGRTFVIADVQLQRRDDLCGMHCIEPAAAWPRTRTLSKQAGALGGAPRGDITPLLG